MFHKSAPHVCMWPQRATVRQSICPCVPRFSIKPFVTTKQISRNLTCGVDQLLLFRSYKKKKKSPPCHLSSSILFLRTELHKLHFNSEHFIMFVFPIHILFPLTVLQLVETCGERRWLVAHFTLYTESVGTVLEPGIHSLTG